MAIYLSIIVLKNMKLNLILDFLKNFGNVNVSVSVELHPVIVHGDADVMRRYDNWSATGKYCSMMPLHSLF